MTTWPMVQWLALTIQATRAMSQTADNAAPKEMGEAALYGLAAESMSCTLISGLSAVE